MSLPKIFQIQKKKKTKKLVFVAVYVASIESKMKLVYKWSLKRNDYGFHVV